VCLRFPSSDSDVQDLKKFVSVGRLKRCGCTSWVGEVCPTNQCTRNRRAKSYSGGVSMYRITSASL